MKTHRMKLIPMVAALAITARSAECRAEVASPPEAGGQVAIPETDAVSEALSLIKRVLPDHAGAFLCEIIPQEAGKDMFEIEAKGEKIVLRGNNGVTLASAFNWYLRYEYKTNFDWVAAGPLKVDRKPPLPAGKIRQACIASERFALNYCTYGYTFPFWNWDQWQRFIDWMAMNGMNRPLLQCGQEATWLKVWESYGMSREEVQKYFVGPAHLPWQRMVNMDSWGGPLPMSYIEGQRKLQVQILARARALGMKPILTAFAGHVPKGLKKVKPDAKITQIEPGWGGMKEEYSTWFLDPTDPLFTDIQHRFIKAQTEMYGTDNLYGADPFNEIPPPSWEPDYLASVSRTIYQSMAEADPKAVWYMMSWNFFYDKNWTEPRLKALTLAVPKGRLIYLDYVCEQAEFFRQTKNFYGAPFVWCYVGNFGGNTHFLAPLNLVEGRIENALPVENCLGVGTTLEGLNINPVTYDLLYEQPWHAGGKVDLAKWVEAYADRQAGGADPAVRKAWSMLRTDVFNDNPDGIWGRHNFLQTVPTLRGGGSKAQIPIRQAALVASVNTLLEASPASRGSDGYQFDLVNLSRQALGNLSNMIGRRMMAAAVSKDLPAFKRESARLMGLGRDIDTLLGTRHEFLLGPWIADARGWGVDAKEGDYYEHNAREIITTWHEAGGGLSDYARRQLNGLFRTYYMQRWEAFIGQMEKALESGEPFDEGAYQKSRVKGDGEWVKRTGEEFATKPEGDPYQTVSSLMEKYKDQLVVPVSEATLRKPAWSPEVLTGEGEVNWMLDVSESVKGSGVHEVTLSYREGESALEIRKVALMQDGKEIAADTHDGWTGEQSRDNIYKLEVKNPVPGKPVFLMIMATPSSSSDSSGDIKIVKKEDGVEKGKHYEHDFMK